MKKIITLTITTIACTINAFADFKMIQKEMDDFQKPMVLSLQSVLQKDPQLSPEYKIYLNELKELQQIKDPAERLKLTQELNIKNRNLFIQAMKKAKIDENQSKRKAEELSKKYSKKDAQYIVQSGEFLTYTAWLKNQKTPNPPIETEVEFRPPFEFEHSARNGQGIISVRLEAGRMFASSYNTIIGSYQNRAGVGMFLRIPWLNRLVRISARLPEFSFDVTATAGLGGSGAKSMSLIDVVGENGELCKKSIEHAIAIAPVVWHATARGNSTTVFACETFSPPANQDIAIRFQNISEITTGGLAFALAFTSGTPDSIRARLIQ